MQMVKKFTSQSDEVCRLNKDIEKYLKERNKLDNELHMIETKLKKFNKIKLTENSEGKDTTKRMKDVARKRRMLDQMKA